MKMRHLWMTGLGLGYAPFASGTFGSAGAAAIALGIWALCWQVGCPPLALDAVWLILAVLATVGCGLWGEWAITYFAGRSRKPGDPGQVVLDEWAGQWVALIALPMATPTQAMAVLAVQFFLFRLFDVLKPPPARQLEKLHGGWGIALDDVAAGIYANLIGQVVFRMFWP
jgi:phosphatidylglycerophosphatase A